MHRAGRIDRQRAAGYFQRAGIVDRGSADRIDATRRIDDAVGDRRDDTAGNGRVLQLDGRNRRMGGVDGLNRSVGIVDRRILQHHKAAVDGFQCSCVGHGFAGENEFAAVCLDDTRIDDVHG